MNEETVTAFKQKLKAGAVFGPFSKTCDPGVIEVLAHSGFDFVILDMEHGPSSVETVQSLIRSAELSGIVPIVRVPSTDEEIISNVLDVGAAGVQVPKVTCAADVHDALNASKFAPLGKRGVCRYVRAANYSSMDKERYFSKAANEALLIVQLEGLEALKNLDEILDVEGIDIIFIGPYDLSQSLGVPGQVDHPSVIEKTTEIVNACRAKEIAVGNFTETAEQSRFWIDKGLTYMSFSVDLGLLYTGAKQIVDDLKS